MISAADRIVRMGRLGGNGDGGVGGTTLDYNSIGKDKLLKECASRGWGLRA